MRHIAAMLGLIFLTGLPLFASVETRVYDYSYRVSAQSNSVGVQIDWAKQAILITTKATAPLEIHGPDAHDVARDMALESARVSLADFYQTLHVTAYASLSEALLTGYLPRELNALPARPGTLVAEAWDSFARTITLVSAVPLTGPGSPNELAACMLKVEQEVFPKQEPLQLYKSADFVACADKLPVKQLSPGPYTGIMLDCTKMHYTPVLLPKLIAKDGTVCWGLQGINPSDVANKGLIRCATSVDDAVTSG